MTTLFSKLDKIKYLQIVHNDKPADLGFKEIFDSNSFDEISITTFVSSPGFFFENIKPFKNVTLILGIEDNESISRFYFDPVVQNEFYKDADKETILKIRNGNLKIFFSPLNTAIHSKIYILKNSQTGNARLILGSANFTENAFSGKRQFEEIIVFDNNYNPAIVKLYEERFSYILNQCVDYVPERLKKKIKEGVTINNINLSEDDYIEALKDNVKRINQTITVTEDTARELDILKSTLHNDEASAKSKLESINRTRTIFEAVSKNKDGVVAIITPSEITKKKETIISKTFIKEDKKIFTDNRIKTYYSKSVESIFREDVSSGCGMKFAAKADLNVLKEKIVLLNKFINAYDEFTINEVKETKLRIFEAILYSFISPYIWKLRDEYARMDNKNEARASVPIYLLIAGQSQTGKTHLVKFISKVMGNYGNYYHFTKQSRLASLDHINPQIIDNYFYEENLTPVFVDEISKEYFSSQSSVTSNYMGEDYVKKITNTKEGLFPGVIATSNTDFSANPQVMRRIYYIQLNNPFDPDKKTKTSNYFNEIYESFGTEIFQDFLLRLEQRFTEGMVINQEDFLSVGRSIFLEYFTEIDIPIPAWFSPSRIDDYYLRGKQLWQRLYKMRKKGFNEDKSKNEITIDDDIIFGSKITVSRDKREWLQYLHAGIIKEDKGLVVLNREKFLEFISNEQGVLSFFKRLKKT